MLRSETYWDGVGYTTSFDTEPGVWQTIKLPWSKFIPVFRAKVVNDAPPLDVKSITSVQLMISKFEYDGSLNPNFEEGPFSYPVQRIGAYRDQNK